jgi:tRNA nucleotidyltransferase/poly(A) polymerase
MKTDLLSDAKSKDFTMNALYFNLEDLRIIDPLDSGLKDIEKRVISLCDPKYLLKDPIRIFKAIRLAATYQFELSEEIKNDIIGMQPVFDYTPIKTLNLFSLLEN